MSIKVDAATGVSGAVFSCVQADFPGCRKPVFCPSNEPGEVLISVKSSVAQWIARTMMVLTAITGITFVASPAPALAACSQQDCAGLDPQAQGCSPDAKRMGDFQGTPSGPTMGWTVELRYSPKCRAMWTRIIVDYSFNPTRPPIQIRVHRQQYNNQQLEWQTSGDHTATLNTATGTKWTKMVVDYSSGDRTRNCYRLGTSGSWTCADWA